MSKLLTLGDPLRLILLPCEGHESSHLVIEVNGQNAYTGFFLPWKGRDDGKYQIEYSYNRAGALSLKLFRDGQPVESDAYPSGLRPVLRRAVQPEEALNELYHALVDGLATVKFTIVIIAKPQGKEEQAAH